MSGSLIMALIFIPVLGVYFGRSGNSQRRKEHNVIKFSKFAIKYSIFVRRLITHPIKSLVIILIILFMIILKKYLLILFHI